MSHPLPKNIVDCTLPGPAPIATRDRNEETYRCHMSRFLARTSRVKHEEVGDGHCGFRAIMRPLLMKSGVPHCDKDPAHIITARSMISNTLSTRTDDIIASWLGGKELDFFLGNKECLDERNGAKCEKKITKFRQEIHTHAQIVRSAPVNSNTGGICNVVSQPKTWFGGPYNSDFIALAIHTLVPVVSFEANSHLHRVFHPDLTQFDVYINEDGDLTKDNGDVWIPPQHAIMLEFIPGHFSSIVHAPQHTGRQEPVVTSGLELSMTSISTCKVSSDIPALPPMPKDMSPASVNPVIQLCHITSSCPLCK